MGDWIPLETPHGTVRTWQERPDGRAAGGIVLVQEIFGVNAHIRDVAARFASEGFEVLAPSLFDAVEPGVELGYDEAGIARGRSLGAALGFDRAVDIVGAAAGALENRGVRAAAVGFCWGGTVAFLADTRLGLPAVSYYGGRSLPFLDEPARAPLLLHFGEHDPIIPAEHRELHRLKQPRAEIHVYDAGHGFNCDRRADYDPAAAQQAWPRTLRFLREALA